MVNKHNKKYKAITCEVLELLAKHGLNVEEIEFVANYAVHTAKAVSLVTQPKLEDMQALLR